MGSYSILKNWLACAAAGALLYSIFCYAGRERGRQELASAENGLESKAVFVCAQEDIFQDLPFIDRWHPAIQGYMSAVRAEKEKSKIECGEN